jgi:hypothetical protein
MDGTAADDDDRDYTLPHVTGRQARFVVWQERIHGVGRALGRTAVSQRHQRNP